MKRIKVDVRTAELRSISISDFYFDERCKLIAPSDCDHSRIDHDWEYSYGSK